MIFAQHYKMKASEAHLEQAGPGQYVLDQDDHDRIVGFIDFVNRDTREVAVMLMEPMEMPLEMIEKDELTIIQERCDWQARLLEILDEYPEMAEWWEMTGDCNG